MSQTVLNHSSKPDIDFSKHDLVPSCLFEKKLDYFIQMKSAKLNFFRKI